MHKRDCYLVRWDDGTSETCSGRAMAAMLAGLKGGGTLYVRTERGWKKVTPSKKEPRRGQ